MGLIIRVVKLGATGRPEKSPPSSHRNAKASSAAAVPFSLASGSPAAIAERTPPGVAAGPEDEGAPPVTIDDLPADCLTRCFVFLASLFVGLSRVEFSIHLG